MNKNCVSIIFNENQLSMELNFYNSVKKGEKIKLIQEFFDNLLFYHKINESKMLIFDKSRKIIKLNEITNETDNLQITLTHSEKINKNDVIIEMMDESKKFLEKEKIKSKENISNSQILKSKPSREDYKTLIEEDSHFIINVDKTNYNKLEINKNNKNDEENLNILAENKNNEEEEIKNNSNENNKNDLENLMNLTENINLIKIDEENLSILTENNKFEDINRLENKLEKDNFVIDFNKNPENIDKNNENLLEKSLKEELILKPDIKETIRKKDQEFHYFFHSGDVELIPYVYVENNKYILATSKCVGLFSFLPQNTSNLSMPPPIYINYQILCKKKGTSKKEIFFGNEITETGQLKLVNKEILDKQKGIISEMVRKISQSISEGRGIVGVSMPVRIFEPRSSIERIIDWWAYTPVYLSPAAALTNPIERLKKVVAFAYAGLSVSVSQLKPFNPLLGETFQAYFPDNTEIYCEHTSHHPPISNFLLIGKGFQYYGRYEYVAKPNATFNALNFLQDGPNTVVFSDGQKIIYTLPEVKMSGMIMGERLIKYHGVMRFYDETNGIKCILKIGAEEKKKGFFAKKRTDLVEGKIYYKNKSVVEKVCKKKKEQDKIDLKYADVDKVICEISGSWLQNLVIDKEEVWNFDKTEPVRHTPIKNPLPSDARFREDLIWLKYENLKFAEAWKIKLEEQQRHERKLRTDFQKKKKK